jgi:hypothetical protein
MYRYSPGRKLIFERLNLAPEGSNPEMPSLRGPLELETPPPIRVKVNYNKRSLYIFMKYALKCHLERHGNHIIVTYQ